MKPDAVIYVAGHRGLVGSRLVQALRQRGYTNLVLRTRQELDLRAQCAVNDFFEQHRPAYVFMAAARVGGILANDTWPARFIGENLAMQTNVIDAAYRNGCEKLLFLGSSCIYPRLAAQPIREDSLLSGPLEPTNEWYAVAKIAGIKTCQAYRREFGFNAICAMPTNLYGPGDNFDLQTSHVLAALIRKFHEAARAGAPEVSVWGSGTPRREFLHVDDLADALIYLMREYDSEEIINVGTGKDISIRELAELVGDIVGYDGEIVLDPSKPDGTPRKLLDVSRLANAGWRARISLEDGLRATYEWYVANAAS